MRQIFIVLAVTLLLAACTRLHSNVSTYSNIQDGYQNSGTYQGTTTYTPTYGITGYQTGTRTETVYGRGLVLEIFQPSPGQRAEKVYEARLGSAGECGNLNAVMDALFEEFPHQTSGEVTVPFNGDC